MEKLTQEGMPATTWRRWTDTLIFNKRARLIVGIVFFGIFYFVMIKNAWVCDDAFIVLRSVEQVFTGNGPTWNPHERVQAFTSPLWFLALCGLRIFTQDGFVLLMTLSVICSIAVLLTLLRFYGWGMRAVICIALLICSNSFFDFTTSGLENPLAYFLLSMFLLCSVRVTIAARENGTIQKCMLGALCALSLIPVCRHDLATFALFPAISLIIVLKRNVGVKKTLLYTVACIMPLLIWTIFSLVYYGAPFPNTYYAKTHTGISHAILAMRGFRYLLTSIKLDPVLGCMLLAGPLAFLMTVGKRGFWFVLAPIVNIIYIVSVGGDFMAGRFLSYAYIWSVLLFVLSIDDLLLKLSCWLRHQHPAPFTAFTKIGLLFAVLSYAILFHHTPLNSSINYSNKVILGDVADERGFYFAESSLWRYVNRREGSLFPVSKMSEAGVRFAASDRDYSIILRIGAYGYWAGTSKTIVDPMALADPFLSRIPVRADSEWRIGHFRRDIPEGYIESLATGKARMPNLELNTLFQQVSIATRSKDWFSRHRIAAIIALHFR